ncbi:hypothetical protein AVO42_03045 [Thiomicrospira sp. XS5]|uniref:OmpA family protein n=1 Tax=Thiomicrospira sp. XS5 TaxID=1775636 RepID=UPI0007499FD8|nr:OmpA family protein [Thiomicrospira sp. XS5]KUJ74400.1 hypothetical protein AVO42_03045 [Thiomicrospira sp. XS5]
MKQTSILALYVLFSFSAHASGAEQKETPYAIETIEQSSDDSEQVSTLYKDLDQDGVPDRQDQCLNSKLGYKVNELGCELDSDQDGVFDSTDQCPNTPKDVKVNFLGCEGDNDKDLVLDSQDQCPETPLGTKVNAYGCKENNDLDKDGIINQEDQCPETPTGSSVNRYGCIPQAVVTTNIVFNTGSYQIRADQTALLQKNVSQLKNLEPDEVILLTGYTDSRGSSQSNMKLSWNRAKSAKDYMIQNFNYDNGKIFINGQGESHPVAENNSRQGRQKNRRIEFKILKKPEIPSDAQLQIPEKMKHYNRYQQ